MLQHQEVCLGKESMLPEEHPKVDQMLSADIQYVAS